MAEKEYIVKRVIDIDPKDYNKIKKMISEKRVDETIKWWEEELRRTKEIYKGSIKIFEIKTILKTLYFIKKGYVECRECCNKEKELRYQKYKEW